MKDKAKGDARRRESPTGDPAMFKRTKAQEEEALARLDAEVKAMQARGVPPTLDVPLFDAGSRGGDPMEALAELRSRAEQWQDERRSLPCWRAIYPAGVPEGFLSIPADGAVAIKGRLACKAAPLVTLRGEQGETTLAQRDACRYAHEHPTCLWDRAEAARERALHNLMLGLGTEAEEEHKLVMAALDLDAPEPLRETDPLLIARSWLAGGRRRMTLANAAKLAPLTGEELAAGAPVALEMTGDERLMVWGGNPGRGKTVAAIWALARRGGAYVLDYQLARPFDVNRAVGVAGVLVIDQLQTADPDKQRFASRRCDEIAVRRFAAGRKTLIIGNIDYASFAVRFGQVATEGGKMVIKHAGNIAERCSQAGAFIVFGGESMRAAP